MRKRKAINNFSAEKHNFQTQASYIEYSVDEIQFTRTDHSNPV